MLVYLKPRCLAEWLSESWLIRVIKDTLTFGASSWVLFVTVSKTITFSQRDPAMVRADGRWRLRAQESKGGTKTPLVAAKVRIFSNVNFHLKFIVFLFAWTVFIITWLWQTKWETKTGTIVGWRGKRCDNRIICAFCQKLMESDRFRRSCKLKLKPR